MANARDERHRYGQHYTPETVARLLAALAVRSATDLVFDPSCGDGRLLRAALEIKECIPTPGARTLPGRVNSGDPGLFGIDRSAAAAAQAQSRGLAAAEADFFQVEPGKRISESVSLPRQFDSIVGNPPYIRQEIMSASDKRRIARKLGASRDGRHQPKWSRRSDMYVYFFARAIDFLRPGGTLAFLTASSWLSVGYGEPLKEFFLENFRIIAVIESAVESFFTDASINTAITVLQRDPDLRSRDSNLVRFIQLRTPLAVATQDKGAEGALKFARHLECATEPSPDFGIRIVKQSLLNELSGKRPRARTSAPTPVATPSSVTTRTSGSSWSIYAHAADVFFLVKERGRALLRPLGGMAAVRFGMKTGANQFFYLRGGTADEPAVVSPTPAGPHSSAGLKPLGAIAAVRRGLTTGANEFFYVAPAPIAQRLIRGKAMRKRALLHDCDPDLDVIEVQDKTGASHRVERRYLSPVIFSLKEISGIRFAPAAASRFFFNCSDDTGELKGTRALEYIRAGERAGFHRRPTCAARDPWYSVARDWKPAPLIFPSKVGERWLIAINEGGVIEDKKLYGVFPNRAAATRPLAALLNSTWARYCAEMTARQMTGAQAIADIDVVVAGQILIPDPDDLSPDQLSELDAALEALCRRPVVSVFDEVIRSDRRRLDELVLAAIGFTHPDERAQVLKDLYQAVTELVSRRLDRSRKRAAVRR
jgi:hypothetical protein